MYKQQNYQEQSQQNQNYTQKGQHDIESQKQVGSKKQTANNEKNANNLTKTQTNQTTDAVEDEQHKKNKESFFRKCLSLFKQSENKFSGQWLDEEIVKQVNLRRENNIQIKKFMQTMEGNNKYIYLKTCEFSDGINGACEKYFYPQDQKKVVQKKFRGSIYKRLKQDKEMTVQEYENHIKIRRTIIQQQEDPDNSNPLSQRLSTNIKGLEKQTSKAESNTNSANINKQFNRFSPNINQPLGGGQRNHNRSLNDSRMKIEQSNMGDSQIDKEGQVKRDKIKGDDDDFSIQQSSFSQAVNNQIQLEREQEEQYNSQSEEDSDEEDEEGEKKRKEVSDDDNEQDEEEEDQSSSENEEGSDDQDKEDGSDVDENENEDDDDDDDDEEQDKDNNKQDDKSSRQFKKVDTVVNFNQDLLKGSSLMNQNMKHSKTLNYSKSLAKAEPRFFEIVKDKVERIRIQDMFENNVICFRIFDQQIDSYLPELLNRLTTVLYNSTYFQHVIYSVPQDFDLQTVVDPTVKKQIRNLSSEAKKSSFITRSIEQLKFFSDEGEEIKNQIKQVNQNIEQEQFQKYSYNITGNSMYGAQYKQNFEKSKKKREDSEFKFKKSFGRYLFHREEDLFFLFKFIFNKDYQNNQYLIYHLFNKQMYYHSECLDEINKFDRWLLVNQGDLEKLKEKKKKDDQGINQGKENVVDQMKIILQEVDKYLQIVQTFNTITNNLKQQPEKIEVKKKRSKK